MKQFILYASKAVTSPDFTLDDLPGSGGRMDLVARCICNALWISHDLRRDTCIHIVACGTPNPPVVISFFGDRLRGVSPDERNIAAWIKKALALKRKNPGISIRKLSFQQLIEKLASGRNAFYILTEKGIDIGSVKLKANPVVILGDHEGLPKEADEFVERFEHEKISLGSVSYLASQCISVVHYELDKNLNPNP
jgi:tRNA (pseudouridine54-N1)-methyltransferase